MQRNSTSFDYSTSRRDSIDSLPDLTNPAQIQELPVTSPQTSPKPEADVMVPSTRHLNESPTANSRPLNPKISDQRSISPDTFLKSITTWSPPGFIVDEHEPITDQLNTFDTIVPGLFSAPRSPVPDIPDWLNSARADAAVSSGIAAVSQWHKPGKMGTKDDPLTFFCK